jgi:hypothetical protein
VLSGNGIVVGIEPSADSISDPAFIAAIRLFRLPERTPWIFATRNLSKANSHFGVSRAPVALELLWTMSRAVSAPTGVMR